MARKAADLSDFQVNIEKPPKEAPRPAPKKTKHTPAPSLITKGFRVKPEAARQFDMLKGGNQRRERQGQRPRIDCGSLKSAFQKAWETAGGLNALSLKKLYIYIFKYINFAEGSGYARV